VVRLYHGEVSSWGDFVIMGRFCYRGEVLLPSTGFDIKGRLCYHWEVLSWGDFVFMVRFCYHGDVLLSWKGFFNQGEVLLSWGGFIMERFYHGEVLLSWGGFLEQYTICKSLHVIQVLLNSLYIQ
jgi:hypothetical protein